MAGKEARGAPLHSVGGIFPVRAATKIRFFGKEGQGGLGGGKGLDSRLDGFLRLATPLNAAADDYHSSASFTEGDFPGGIRRCSRPTTTPPSSLSFPNELKSHHHFILKIT